MIIRQHAASHVALYNDYLSEPSTTITIQHLPGQDVINHAAGNVVLHAGLSTYLGKSLAQQTHAQPQAVTLIV